MTTPTAPGGPSSSASTDPGRRSGRCDWAVDHARQRRVPLVAVHAWHLPYTTHGWLRAVPDPAELASDADHFLQTQLDRVDTTGLVAPVECRAVADRPTTALVEASRTRLARRRRLARPRPARRAPSSAPSATRSAHHATSPVVVVP